VSDVRRRDQARNCAECGKHYGFGCPWHVTALIPRAMRFDRVEGDLAVYVSAEGSTEGSSK
jgi:hypothetical protein